MTLSAAERANLQARVDQYHWFHSIDLGGGVVAHGAKTLDYINTECELILGPIDLRGTSVLDVGAINGYYSFAAKRRGATRVIASDSWAWRDAHFRAKETFDLARATLDVDVETLEIDPTELTKAAGVFDVVLYLGVFYHLIEPIYCTRRLSECAGRLLILESHLDALASPQPAMIFYPGAELNNDLSNWWGPNPHLLYDLMIHCGFQRVFFRYHCGERGVFYCFRSQADADHMLVAPLVPPWFDLGNAEHRARVFNNPCSPEWTTAGQEMGTQSTGMQHVA
jgi:tRNA (mo5U34)-methyltransferase